MLTPRQVAERIAKDRSDWMTKQFKKILPNRLFCIVRNRDDDKMPEVEAYMVAEKVKIDLTPLTARISKAGRLISTWEAKLNRAPDPLVVPVHSPIVITDQDESAKKHPNA